MLPQYLFVLLPALVSAMSIPCAPQVKLTNERGCSKGVHIFGIRGTLEEEGYGALGPLVQQIIDRIPGSDGEAIVYPAAGIDVIGENIIPRPFEYAASVGQGHKSMTDAMIDYYEKCPETRTVLMGYSQGAHVVGNTLCGGSSFGFLPSLPIPDQVSYNVAAVIQLGDPTNREGLPWHVGNSTRSGLFPRQSLMSCYRLGEVWQSYCDAKDIFCDSTGDVKIHLTYADRYGDDIVKFVVAKVKEYDDEL